MKKSNQIIYIVILILLAFLIGLIVGWQIGKVGGEESCKSDPLNAFYNVEGELYTVGDSKSASPSSVSKVEVKAWDKPVYGDLNNDGDADAALVFFQESSAGGKFYYIASAVKNQNTGEYKGTNAILLGDRISPQKVSIAKGIIDVDYLGRSSSDSITTDPYIEISRKFKIGEGDILEEVK